MCSTQAPRAAPACGSLAHRLLVLSIVAALLARAPNAGLEWFFFVSCSKTQDAVHPR